MAPEHETQDERDGVGNRPTQPAPAEQLEEEDPTQSPAQTKGGTRTDREGSRERASTSMESPTLTTKSTEGITVGGTKKTASD